jgi:hypothetical protein
MENETEVVSVHNLSFAEAEMYLKRLQCLKTQAEVDLLVQKLENQKKQPNIKREEVALALFAAIVQRKPIATNDQDTIKACIELADQFIAALSR